MKLQDINFYNIGKRGRLLKDDTVFPSFACLSTASNCNKLQHNAALCGDSRFVG